MDLYGVPAKPERPFFDRPVFDGRRQIDYKILYHVPLTIERENL